MCLHCVLSRMESSLRRLIVGLMVRRAAIQLLQEFPVFSIRGRWRGGIVFCAWLKRLHHTINVHLLLLQTDLCLYFEYLTFVTVLQWLTTGIPRTQTVVWLHHRILILCCQAVAWLQSLGQHPSSIQSNRGEPNPERDRGEGPSPALSPGLKKASARWVTLSHRVSFYFWHVWIL